MKNPLIKATMAVSVVALAALVGCADGAPTAANSQMSVRQIDKVNSKVNAAKPSEKMGSIVVKINRAVAPRKVLYNADDIQHIALQYTKTDGTVDDFVQLTSAQIAALPNKYSFNLTVPPVPVGTYDLFLRAWDGDPALAGTTMLNQGNTPATATITVTDTPQNVPMDLRLAATAVVMGTFTPIVTVIDGE